MAQPMKLSVAVRVVVAVVHLRRTLLQAVPQNYGRRLLDSGQCCSACGMHPPGTDTNGFTIFTASPSEIRALTSSTRTRSFETGNANPAFSGPAGQSTLTPGRPPTDAAKNSLGDIGVAFFAHLATNSYANPFSASGLPGARVKIENGTGGVRFDPIPEAGEAANDFVATMMGKGWWGPNSFNLSGSTLHVNNLRAVPYLAAMRYLATSTLVYLWIMAVMELLRIFNTDAKDSLQTYMAGDNPSDAGAPWLRLSEFGFGGNLRFMAILACNPLRDQNANSMKSQGSLPIKSNLHLLCSASTFSACGDVGGLWAYNMTGGIFRPAQTIVQAWFNAGQTQYTVLTNWTYGTIIFRVAGQDNCFGDKLKSYQSSTSGNISHQDQQVYP